MNMHEDKQLQYLRHAIYLAETALKLQTGGPFGCVVVYKQKIIGQGYNRIVADKDPTAHAEMNAIRNACKHLGTYQLDHCVLYTSCHPCLMCIGAIYWANIPKIVYANSAEQMSKLKFLQKNNDQLLYKDITNSYSNGKVQFRHVPMAEATRSFEDWMVKMSSQ